MCRAFLVSVAQRVPGLRRERFRPGFSADSSPQAFNSNDSITLNVIHWTLTVGVR